MTMFENPEMALRFVQAEFGQVHACVIGNSLLERFVYGEAVGLSSEITVPTIKVLYQTDYIGGAGNVALRLANFGLHVTLFGFGPGDTVHTSIERHLSQEHVETVSIATAYKTTPLKTLYYSGRQLILEVDTGDLTPLLASSVQELVDSIQHHVQQCSEKAVVICEHQGDILDAENTSRLIFGLRSAGVPIIISPASSNYRKYSGATLLICNQVDVDTMTSSLPTTALSQEKRMVSLLDDLNVQTIAIVDPMRGISSFIEHDRVTHLSLGNLSKRTGCRVRETIVAALTAGFVSGLSLIDAGNLANFVLRADDGADFLVSSNIQSSPDAHETRVSSSSQADKICSLNKLLGHIAQWRRSGDRIVFTNGCFDLLHAGHVSYLEGARQAGDRLIVGLNTDESVRRLKGPDRPIIQQQDRARLLAALVCVDSVILFDDDTPVDLIRMIRPDILAKGDDYTEEEVVGGQDVKSWGGTILLVPVLSERSTSRIISRIGELHSK